MLVNKVSHVHTNPNAVTCPQCLVIKCPIFLLQVQKRTVRCSEQVPKAVEMTPSLTVLFLFFYYFFLN